MAEREGFEPSIRVNVYTLSRRAPSATRPPLQHYRAPLGARRNLMGMGRGCNHFLHQISTPFLEATLKLLSLDFDRQNFFTRPYAVKLYAGIRNSIIRAEILLE